MRDPSFSTSGLDNNIADSFAPARNTVHRVCKVSTRTAHMFFVGVSYVLCRSFTYSVSKLYVCCVQASYLRRPSLGFRLKSFKDASICHGGRIPEYYQTKQGWYLGTLKVHTMQITPSLFFICFQSYILSMYVYFV